MDDHALKIAIADLLTSWGFHVEEVQERSQARTPGVVPLASEGQPVYE